MEEKTLIINDYVRKKKGITPLEGKPLFDEITINLKRGNKVILDFSGTKLMTTAFLNAVIGNLYKNHTSKQLKRLLDFKTSNELTIQRIKRVINTSKLYFKDEKSFNKTFNKVVYGND